MTPEEKAAMQRRANGGGIIYWGSDVVGFGVDAWNSMNTLQKASMFLAPIASDIAGVLGDIQMYREQPDTRGMLNYGMTAASLLPFVPAMSATVRGYGQYGDDVADAFDYPPAENAGKTQIAGTKPTYEKAAKILDESAPKGKSIDYGAGLGVGAGAIKYDT